LFGGCIDFAEQKRCSNGALWNLTLILQLGDVDRARRDVFFDNVAADLWRQA